MRNIVLDLELGQPHGCTAPWEQYQARVPADSPNLHSALQNLRLRDYIHITCVNLIVLTKAILNMAKAALQRCGLYTATKAVTSLCNSEERQQTYDL